MPLPSTPAPVVPMSASATDIIAASVEWIHGDPFVRETRSNGIVKPVPGAPTGTGWDFRIREYAVTKSKSRGFPAVNSVTSPVIARMGAIIGNYSWSTIPSLSGLSAADELQLRTDAEWICRTWGGVPQKSYSQTWQVIRAAVTNQSIAGVPMSSGWTKVASFATHGLPNAQTIWDSRAAISVIMRIDGVLTASGLGPSAVRPFRLGFGSGSASGLRPNKLALIRNKWPNGYGRWDYHFGGSEVVREMVKILNDPASPYPPMPLPSGGSGPWDVFGVGLVLFMDGY